MNLPTCVFACIILFYNIVEKTYILHSYKFVFSNMGSSIYYVRLYIIYKGVGGLENIIGQITVT